MTEEELIAFRGREYRASRFPSLDAICTFVPTGNEDEPAIREALARKGQSRWYPKSGGHKLLILNEGEPVDSARFTLEKGAWDHEHCNGCRARIPSMTLCWVSVADPYTILCEHCYGAVTGAA
jgi:hypothetical protein